MGSHGVDLGNYSWKIEFPDEWEAFAKVPPLAILILEPGASGRPFRANVNMLRQARRPDQTDEAYVDEQLQAFSEIAAASVAEGPTERSLCELLGAKVRDSTLLLTRQRHYRLGDDVLVVTSVHDDPGDPAVIRQCDTIRNSVVITATTRTGQVEGERAT
jgi:hypothetical protein